VFSDKIQIIEFEFRRLATGQFEVTHMICSCQAPPITQTPKGNRNWKLHIY